MRQSVGQFANRSDGDGRQSADEAVGGDGPASPTPRVLSCSMAAPPEQDSGSRPGDGQPIHPEPLPLFCAAAESERTRRLRSAGHAPALFRHGHVVVAGPRNGESPRCWVTGAADRAQPDHRAFPHRSLNRVRFSVSSARSVIPRTASWPMARELPADHAGGAFRAVPASTSIPRTMGPGRQFRSRRRQRRHGRWHVVAPRGNRAGVV